MAQWKFKMFYDSECPFCKSEVQWLQKINSKGHLAFEDITKPEFNPDLYGLTHEEVNSTLHGVFPDGKVVDGVDAIRESYRAVGLGFLVAPTRWPIARSIFDALYIVFAKNRVRLGELFGRKCSKGTCPVHFK